MLFFRVQFKLSFLRVLPSVEVSFRMERSEMRNPLMRQFETTFSVG